MESKVSRMTLVTGQVQVDVRTREDKIKLENKHLFIVVYFL